jgi:hypothetical protein
VLEQIGHNLGVTPDIVEREFITAVHKYLRYSEVSFQTPVLAAKYASSRNGCIPDYIAFLAFCVLAASKMERDEDLSISSANYYVRLNALLGIDKQGRPNGFEQTIIVWEKLNEWLNTTKQGRYGIATACPLNDLNPYVGYPQSQCLIRAADRQELPAFFHWARLQPEDSPNVEWLKRMLYEWAGMTTCTFSQRTRQLLCRGHANISQHVVSIVLLELQVWGGTIPSNGTANSAPQRPLLHLRFDRRRIHWRSYTLCEQASALGRYCVESLPCGPEWLKHDTCSRGEEVVVFGNHPDLGEWTHLPRITPGYPSVLLIHQSHAQAVVDYLTRVAQDPGTVSSFSNLPTSWICLRGVVVTHNDATCHWECLKVQDDVTIRLSGGLKLERAVYLAGFEPTADIFISDATVISSITLNDQKLSIQLQNGMNHIPLHDYCQSTGYHTLNIGERSKGFITRQAHGATLPPDELPPIRYVLQKHGSQYMMLQDSPILAETSVLDGQIHICGAIIHGDSADMPGTLPHLLLVPDGFKRYIVLGRTPGEFFLYPKADSRRIIKFDPTLRKRNILLSIPFSPQWLIKQGQKKKYLSTACPWPLLPNISSIDYTPLKVQEWCRWIRRSYNRKWCDANIDNLWQAYQNTANTLSGAMQ